MPLTAESRECGAGQVEALYDGRAHINAPVGVDAFAFDIAAVLSGAESWNDIADDKTVALGRRPDTLWTSVFNALPSMTTTSSDRNFFQQMIPVPLHPRIARLRKILPGDCRSLVYVAPVDLRPCQPPPSGIRQFDTDYR